MEPPKRASIEGYFEEYIFGFMYHDIDAAIAGKANYLAALGLLSYTEVMGGLVTGKLQCKGGEGERFSKFLHEYVGKAYADTESGLKADPTVRIDQKGKHPIYSVFRCGLVHEYFIKSPAATVAMRNVLPQPCGIVKRDGRWLFVVEKYYDDFRHGVEKYYGQLLDVKNTDLRLKFWRAIQQTPSGE